MYLFEELNKIDDEESLGKVPHKRVVKNAPINEGIDGWDNRTGIIFRIHKYLVDNPEVEPPKGYIERNSREYEVASARYGDYVTTQFGNIKTDDLMAYAEDHGLLN
jgi:hypothetical protein